LAWVPIILPEHARHFPKEEWIRPFVVSRDSIKYRDKCYGKINAVIDRGLDPERYYSVLCDDDLLPHDFFRKLGTPVKPITIVSMLRGQHAKFHPCHMFLAHPTHMRIDYVGLEQFIIRGDYFSRYRFEDASNADGRFVQKVVNENQSQVAYRPDVNVYFNALEPGRWDKVP
jgi:hypothetical protein